MLKNQWPDTPLIIASIKDRNPVEEEDEIVLLAAPDPQSAPACRPAVGGALCMLSTCLSADLARPAGLNESRRIAEAHDEGKHIIMFNPRLMRCSCPQLHELPRMGAAPHLRPGLPQL